MPSTSLVISDEGECRPDEQLTAFNPQMAAPFVNTSISAETRRLYRRVIRDFFNFVGSKSETQVTQEDVLGWRDRLRFYT